jgi:Ras family protein T1
MTRVRLPPDPENACVTTIVDSQGGDAALISAVAALTLSNPASSDSLAALVERAESSMSTSHGMTQTQSGLGAATTMQMTPTKTAASKTPKGEPDTGSSMSMSARTAMNMNTAMNTNTATDANANANAAAGMDKVDSIILVYDLDRVETFFRLENHWLPLIERCYNGKVRYVIIYYYHMLCVPGTVCCAQLRVVYTYTTSPCYHYMLLPFFFCWRELHTYKHTHKNTHTQVPVIVAENKMDLFRPSSSAAMTDEQALARKRQQIVSLMQRFPFVRQCIKCSAKNLLRVDDIFLKAQQAVLYPFTPPLYDLETGRLTVECKRAFTRIFRMYDRDHDGLLSDAELDRFQRETYHVAVFDRDLAAWKKVVTRNNPTDEAVIQDGIFTIPGFLAIFDVFISQNRLDVVWQALRKFGYDDDLNLHVPESVTTPNDENSLARNWKLSTSAKKFLANMFHQFDSDNDGVVSADDILSMFSILPPPALPPWHPARASKLFGGCFSLPKEVASDISPRSSSNFSESLIVPAVAMSQALSNSGLSILSASDSLPSVDLNMHTASKPLSFLEWMGHWHAISAISPSVTRAELFRLGHVEDSRKKPESRRRSRKKKSISPTDVHYDSSLRSREVRVLVLGSHSSGKTALLNALCGAFDGRTSAAKATDTTATARPETSSAFCKLKRKTSTNGGKADEEGEELVVHLVFTDVPETAAASQEEHYRELSELFGSTTSPKDRVCDLAMLVFDCSKGSSLSYAKELETNLLTKETPRIFVGTKGDLRPAPEPEDGDVYPATVVDAAEIHCRESDLEPPLLTSAADSMLANNSEERAQALDHLARCILCEPGIARIRSRPHEEKKRREAAHRKKMMWFGGVLSVGVVVAVAVGFIWGGTGKKDQRSGLSCWLRSWSQKPTKQ